MLLFHSNRNHFNGRDGIVVARRDLADANHEIVIFHNAAKDGVRRFRGTVKPIQKAIVCVSNCETCVECVEHIGERINVPATLIKNCEPPLSVEMML